MRITNYCGSGIVMPVAVCAIIATLLFGSSGCQGSLSNPAHDDVAADIAVIDTVAELTGSSDTGALGDVSGAGDMDSLVVADVADSTSPADILDIDGDTDMPMDVETDPPDMGEPGFLKWAIPSGPNERFIGVAMDFDGNLIVPREKVDPDDSRIALKETLVKISPDGKILAERELPLVRGYRRPQVRPDGTVLVALVPTSENGGPCSGAQVFAYGPDFEEKWVYSNPFALRRLLAIRSDNVVLGHFGNMVVAVSPEGKFLWQVQLEQSPYCDGDPSTPWLVTSPRSTPIVIDHDDVAYAFEYLQETYKIVAISPGGQVLWKKEYAGELNMDGPAISPEGMVFFHRFAVPQSGDVLYTLPGPYSSLDPFITGIGETVIGGVSGGLLWCQDTENLLWKTAYGIKADSDGLAIRTEYGVAIARGTNVRPKYSGVLGVISAATGELVRQYPTIHYPRLGASVLTDDGVIVGPHAFDFGYPLVAYQLPYGGLAKTGWPKVYADNQNSNRVRGPKASP